MKAAFSALSEGMVMGVREIERSMERRQLEVNDVLRRMYLAPTPRDRERWHALWFWPGDGLPQELGRP